MKNRKDLSQNDRRIVEAVLERLERCIDLRAYTSNQNDQEFFDEIAASITELEILLKEDRRAEDDPNQYELPLAGGFMFADDETPLDFQEAQANRCF